MISSSFIWKIGLACMACAFLCLPLQAQSNQDNKQPTNQELLDRIDALELEVQDLKQKEAAGGGATGQDGDDWGTGGISQGVSASQMGRLGQTTRFSSTFNPAIGVVIDSIANYQTGSDSGENQDRFWLRAAELNMSAQFDPFGYAYATIEANEEEVELIEATAVLNRLPANFSIKGGRMLSDFGKLGQRHDHELPFVEKPLVYYDYIGGSLNSTGVEVHQWFGLTDEIPVRWSVGMFNEMEGHGHAIWFGDHHHHHGDEPEPYGKRKLDNFAYGGRLTGYGDLTENSSLQVGGSLSWAPEKREFHEHAGDTERIKTRQTVAGADVTYKWIDPSHQDEFIAGIEVLMSNGTFFHEDEDEIEDGDALGGYAWGEYSWDPHWAVGAMGGAFERAQHDSVDQRELSAWVTWKISHFNWLRLQYRFNDLERYGDEFSGEDFSEVLLQWTIVFGTHAHGLDW